MFKIISMNVFGALLMLGSVAIGAKPAAAGIFCDLCKVQGCSCSGSQCTSCGVFAADPGQSANKKPVISAQRDNAVTRSVCLRVKGKFIDTRCTDIKAKH